jgi:hypothetical protein
MNAPLRFALRRMRARPLSVLALALALGGAAALIGWSSVTAAVSQQDSVRRSLEERAPGARSLSVLYFTLPFEGDFRASRVKETFAEFASVTGPARRIVIWHSIEPGRPRGTRIVTGRDVRVEDGRLPNRCKGKVCEALALNGRHRLGERVKLGHGLSALVVGTGSLPAGVLPDASELGDRPLFMPLLTEPLGALVAPHGSTVVTSAALDPRKVDGDKVDELRRRLRTEITRLERGDSLVHATAPLRLLDDLARRGKVARERLLLVSGEGAALILAFAAFLAAARRRETQLVHDQLTLYGASRAQAWTTRVAEVAIPALAGTAVALAGLWIVAAVVGVSLPWETVLVICGVAVAGILLLVAALAPPPRPRLGVGALELAAVTALGVVIWETVATGALDPERVADSGAAPVLLLVPALGFFAIGVLLLRLVPLALRLGERLTRSSPFGVRLAFLTAARNPNQVAAATTFLAVALGASLFSLDYQETLNRQSRDEARFTVGAQWRLAGSRRVGTPALRLKGAVEDVQLASEVLNVQVVGLPSARLPDVLGWRNGFSSLSRDEIARRLRPRPVRLSGPRLDGARALRAWARADTDYPRQIVLHLLLPNRSFAHVSLGIVWHRRRLLELPLPPRFRDAELIGVEFSPTYVPLDFKYDPKGFVALGRLEARRADGWSRLPSLAQWKESVDPTGGAGVLSGAGEDIRFDLEGTLHALIHPTFGLPDPRFGFVTGDVPALAGNPVAAKAVDGLVTLDLEGKQLPVRVVGNADLFPTVTSRPSDFLVFDYDTLFAALNADQPGLTPTSESWFFRPQPRPAPHAVGVEPLTARLENDPLAAGTREVLGVAGVLAAVLGLLGLGLATRSALASERLQLAEYEALGVPPRALRRSAQARLIALSAFGIVAGLLGAFLSGRLIAAFVAVSGTARRPLPPIVSVVSWPAVVGVLAAVAVTGLAAAAVLTRRAMRETVAGRLRA